MSSTARGLADVELVDATSPKDDRIDFGRLFGVPLMVGLLVLNGMTFAGNVRRHGLFTTYLSLGSLTATALTTCFYALLIWAYMRRSPAKATHPSPWAAVTAALAAWLPFAFPLLPHGRPGSTNLLAANVLLILGLAFSVWSIRYLDRSFSMVAQARAVVRSGPYAVVRHPLYTGELVALLGTALARPGVWAFALWAAILGLQAYRVRHEEAILAATLEDYRDYQRSTPQLIPLSISRLLRRR